MFNSPSGRLFGRIIKEKKGEIARERKRNLEQGSECVDEREQTIYVYERKWKQEMRERRDDEIRSSSPYDKSCIRVGHEYQVTLTPADKVTNKLSVSISLKMAERSEDKIAKRR